MCKPMPIKPFQASNRFIEAVTINVTEDYGKDTREKIHGKLHAEAIKLGADAVVLVTKGKTHMTAWA